MNTAKILPRGSDMLPADKVGVQRKTKVNIEAWRGTRLRILPSKRSHLNKSLHNAQP